MFLFRTQGQVLMSRYRRNPRGQGHHSQQTTAGLNINTQTMKVVQTADAPQQTFLRRGMVIFPSVIKILWVIKTHKQRAKVPTRTVWIHCIKDRITKTGTRQDQQSKTRICPIRTIPETTALWRARRNTGRRGSTVNQPTRANTNTRNVNTARILGLKATASLTWWRKEPIERKTTRQMNKRNQTTMCWRNSSGNLVGFLYLKNHLYLINNKIKKIN